MDNLTILALDLGTKTGWALRSSDALITSGTGAFRHDRYQGGGMRFLKFKHWLDRMLNTVSRIDAIYFEEVRRHLHGARPIRSIPQCIQIDFVSCHRSSSAHVALYCERPAALPACS